MVLVVCLVALVVIASFLGLVSFRNGRRSCNSKDKGKLPLPPGSMGWPYIGETLQLYSQEPNLFFTSKQTRYGEIFKTHILGYPSVMLASPEAARFVLVTQAHLFKPTYPKSKERLIGPSALFFHQGGYHSRLRKHVQSSLSPEVIQSKVNEVEAILLSTLDSWDGSRVINTFQEMKKFSFEVGILAVFGNLENHYREELKKNYCLVDRGYNCFPWNIPGSRYRKALLARRDLDRIIGEIISERKEKRFNEKNLLGCLLDSSDGKGEILTDAQIADNIIGVLFAAQDTTASVMTWVIKYLHDNPKLLEAVKAEQEAILRSNCEGFQPLSWSQTRAMPITHRVVKETLRMATIISFTYREAVADVEYKGYLIPKGWKVLPLFRNIHHSPDYFADPDNFDPTRFEVSPKPYTFMPFGNGVHCCPGNELAKLEILTLIHHLVTKFRWEVVGSQNGTQYSPFPVPQDGLPARFWKLSP
ncbi:hypothetical protein MLD38_034887 [Melastoma candidum]|uniref:Uncharacterized protein n=1 Tax=Melastoma candidum TaxID=119954 RepID=A0ACB9MBC9_9MYRT|nr:hypothetical protein MLD38_034887 [Melastoma candidum]